MSWSHPLQTITVKLLTTPLQVRTRSFQGISPVWPAFPGKVIKLFFSTSLKTLSLRFNLLSEYRGKVPNLAFWPGEHHGLYSPWDHKELDTTETFTFTSTALWPGSGLSPVARALWLCWTLSPNCPGPPSHARALRAWIAHGEGLCPGLTTLWRGLLTGFLLVEHDL